MDVRLRHLASQGRKALIPYITAGDPTPRMTVELLHALVAGGADLIELGVPFSDPMADGPVIQRACERALNQRTGLGRVLEMVTEFRRRDGDTPVVLMGYLNPVETMGMECFAERAHRAGVDGVLIVDWAVDELEPMVAPLRTHNIDRVLLLSPTSSESRVAEIAGHASGYLYYVSLKGVTGSDRLNVDSVAEKLQQVRRHSRLPVAVGFGVRDAATAHAVAAVADAVVVGSALVATVERHLGAPQQLAGALTAQLAELRSAIDSQRIIS
ncbi:MAG: tryptophan synthase subunit alpha [Gammaproteobacteria bacterium]|nr:tryptophan synthase subunit alpha [Gammaproteobacteria bacterium]